MAKIKDLIDIYDGNAWQKLANELLILKYGVTDFQKIPDEHSGDWGIEGFTHNGYAFQCYSPEKPHPISHLAVLQMGKITKDIKKFKDNEAELSKLIQTGKYKRWFFLTTVFESKLVPAHCAEKTKEILESCSHVESGFEAMVYDADDFFITEIPIYMNLGKHKISLPAKQYADSEIEDHLKNNSTHHKTLLEKLNNANVPTSKQNALVYKFINDYLNWKDMLAELPPDIRELINKKISSLEIDIVLKYELNSNLNANELRNDIEKLKQDILTEVNSLIDSTTIDYLSRGIVAEWLIRCPINF